jgi:hypothetical protein
MLCVFTVNEPHFYIPIAELFFSEAEIQTVAGRLSDSSIRAELRPLRVCDEISALRVITLNLVVFLRQCPEGHHWIPKYKINPGQPLASRN